ncbi:HTH-type transcriptional regulator CynR [Polaromonas vacuolata]|uniref:HTH-type transcriptional regulator CynR n=1 Tax=Polaromonas vacuolata TaxID=37448 RepID=A0A6H2H9D2_9BURK|nr:LysR substrate-binding domain-containing protein [Polaromonas vacuolata]QJC56204.1 HTH-type transcriptional regulator CynR [Polaromonas vacuolata]
MELRQLRYLVRVIELGSMGKAALDLGVVTSTLSQQISRLESELSTRLLQRTSAGVLPTDAGLAFYQQAQLALRHADDAVRSAQQARLSGHVSLGLAPTTAAVLAMPFLTAMHSRYPDIRLRLVESLSGNLADQLNSRQLDLAIIFDTESAKRWSITPLLDERLFVIAANSLPGLPKQGVKRVRIAHLAHLGLVLPSGSHGLRAIINRAFAQSGLVPQVVLEVDGLAVLMSAVQSGIAATIQPGPAIARMPAGSLRLLEISDASVYRRNLLVSLSDSELSPAGLAARVVLREVALQLTSSGQWHGATLHESLTPVVA